MKGNRHTQSERTLPKRTPGEHTKSYGDLPFGVKPRVSPSAAPVTAVPVTTDRFRAFQPRSEGLHDGLPDLKEIHKILSVRRPKKRPTLSESSKPRPIPYDVKAWLKSHLMDVSDKRVVSVSS